MDSLDTGQAGMSHITVDDQQAKAIAEAHGHVEVRDRHGNCLGVVIQILNRETLEIAKRRADSDGPWRTTEQVLNRLESLETE